ncbi:MAG: DUF938 domain-containing protein [Pseudomonadota bacterium]
MRLESASAHRNEGPILGVLQQLFGPDTEDVLEIASGSGQHAAAFSAAFPGVRWWPSDADSRSLASIDLWRADAGQANLQASQRLDVAAPDWITGEPIGDIPETVDGIVCVNMIHISPWASAEGLFAGAAHRLKPLGLMFIYGPFARSGRHTSEGNTRFDASLRDQNPDWGIRELEEVEQLGSRNGLRLDQVVEMPANNLSLVFRW